MSACTAILDALSEGHRLPPDLAAHLPACEPCRHLVEADRALAQGPLPRVRMSATLREAVDHDFAPVRRLSPWQRAVLPVGAIAAVLVAGVVALRGAASITAVSIAYAVALAAVALVGVFLVLHRGETGLGLRPVWRWSYAGAASALFAGMSLARASTGSWHADAAAWLASSPVGGTAVDAVTSDHATSSAYGTCASTGLVFAVVVGLGFLWSARRTVTVQPSASGACAGVAAGLAAAASLQLSCPGGVGHHLAAHGLPILAAALAGAFLGRRALAP